MLEFAFKKMSQLRKLSSMNIVRNLTSILIGFVVSLGVELAGELFDVAQKHLVSCTLSAHLMLKILGLVDLLKRCPQEFILPLRMFDDFLQQASQLDMRDILNKSNCENLH
jgi:hypothetical protein